MEETPIQLMRSKQLKNLSGTQAQLVPPVSEDLLLNPEGRKKSKLSAAEENLQKSYFG